MTDLVVRRLLVDLEAPFAADWCGGDRFRSAFFDALSMSFPVGEQFFIDSVRGGVDALPEADRARIDDDVRAFVGQEATHRRLHGLFNEQLESQGLVNDWGPRALKRLARLEGQDPRHAVAITAAYEHLTAIMAEWMLRRPETLADADERLRTVWQWHAAEECEHRSVAFDVYRALGGDDAWRLRWFRRITKIFVIDATRQTIGNLARSGNLWRLRTIGEAWRFLFGPGGALRELAGPWRAYLRDDFHPSEGDVSLSRRWLTDHAERYVPVGG